MLRRGAGIGGGALLALALSCAVASAVSVPSGPRLAFVKWSVRPLKMDLLSTGPTGFVLRRITGGTRYFRPVPDYYQQPSWSPDGSLIAFSGVSGHFNTEGPGRRTKIFVVGADGSGRRPLRGTDGASFPVFSPDGQTIAFRREREWKKKGRAPVFGTSIWLADLNGAAPRQLTPWRPGVTVTPSSFSPDGSTLGIGRRQHPSSQLEAVAVNVADGAEARLANNATSPMYSPDGSRLALLGVTTHEIVIERAGKIYHEFAETSDVWVANADGSEPVQLTRTPQADELWPSWDPSGSRIAYGEIGGYKKSRRAQEGLGNAIHAINADGTCAKVVVRANPVSAVFGPAWQPGPGRGAGPISC